MFFYRFKYNFKKALTHHFIITTIFLSVVINLVIWLLFWSKISRRDEMVFLHYNIYFGIDLIGEWYKVFLIPLSGVFIIIANSFLALTLFARSKFISYLLFITSFLCQVILIIASLAIIWINI